ncbi:bacitracin ABC transporter ATP-binding protein [Saccharibacillus sp. O23]|uniref:ABC transporter ATP-binding protein n=1 Tax=Saccharibacillus sp. O23 TaxID=2009338 RepID=UPI000B4E3614|nr:ABC transporter ATP-binding protein [Saccharibacillus sp. O23]OWR30692.1 bacitracin ABC transporter ATP-binding protein [Saccharibacillus sp. O23]
MEVLQVKQLNKVYKGKISHEALSDIDLTIQKGETVAVMGPSGSGKTTLLNVISTIDSPTLGEVKIDGQQPHLLEAEELAMFRRRKLGFVFQFFNLLNTLTVAENMALPLALDGVNPGEIMQRVEQMAGKLGISSILNNRTYEISGGQAQRTAVGRALIHRPSLLLADEPTGNLDSKAARDVMELLTRLNQEEGTTLMLVTHDAMAASYCDRVVFIKDGKLYNEINAGENRAVFYQNILDVLSLLGGHRHDFS